MRSLSFAISLALIWTGPILANPSHRVLDTPLQIHGKGASVAWHKEASQLYETSRTRLLNYLEKEKKNAIRTLNAEDLGKTHLSITVFHRIGGWLETYGEPAGSDFKSRAAVMHGHLDRIILASLPLPSTQKYVNNFRDFLAKSTNSRMKALANIEKLCNEKKWEAAEAALFRVYDTLEPGTVFLLPTERPPIYEPFIKVEMAIRMAMSQIRGKASEEELTKAIQELSPKYQETLQQLNSAIAALTTGGTTWQGKELTGPQLVEQVGQLWRETQVQAQQFRAKKWAIDLRPIFDMSRMSSMGQEPADEVAASYGSFSESLMKSLVQLVEADAKLATAETARERYIEYLRAFAPLTRQTNKPAWREELQKALSGFHSKVPAFHQEVESYTAATHELLRWRNRVAIADAGSQKEYLPIAQRFFEGTVSGKVDGVDYNGLFPDPMLAKMQPQLLTASPDVMPIAVQRLLGKKAIVRDMVRITNDSKAAIARYAERNYANVPMPVEVRSELESLKNELMVSDQAPPLTLEATQAILTAERGDMLMVGGDISGVHLEAVVTRFATLPASAAVMSTLGRLPPEHFDGNKLQNMLMRFEITPRWVCHDYFFAVLPPPPNLTASR